MCKAVTVRPYTPSEFIKEHFGEWHNERVITEFLAEQNQDDLTIDDLLDVIKDWESYNSGVCVMLEYAYDLPSMGAYISPELNHILVEVK